jgi:hypothetical protein
MKPQDNKQNQLAIAASEKRMCHVFTIHQKRFRLSIIEFLIMPWAWQHQLRKLMTKTYVFVDPGTSTVQVQVPVTYRYHLCLRESWQLELKQRRPIVHAPGIKPSLPPAIHTDRMQCLSTRPRCFRARFWWRRDARWQSFRCGRQTVAGQLHNGV